MSYVERISIFGREIDLMSVEDNVYEMNFIIKTVYMKSGIQD